MTIPRLGAAARDAITLSEPFKKALQQLSQPKSSPHDRDLEAVCDALCSVATHRQTLATLRPGRAKEAALDTFDAILSQMADRATNVEALSEAGLVAREAALAILASVRAPDHVAVRLQAANARDMALMATRREALLQDLDAVGGAAREKAREQEEQRRREEARRAEEERQRARLEAAATKTWPRPWHVQRGNVTVTVDVR